jgi:hypothetical protein
MVTLDMLSSQRRPLAGRPGLVPQLLAAAEAAGPVNFDDLAGATSCPAVARAHALHLIGTGGSAPA